MRCIVRHTEVLPTHATIIKTQSTFRFKSPIFIRRIFPFFFKEEKIPNIFFLSIDKRCFQIFDPSCVTQISRKNIRSIALIM